MVIRFADAEVLRLDFMRPEEQTQDETAEITTGELYGCMNRLQFISSLLEALPGAEMEMALRFEFFVYHVDAYYAAAYRVRDLLQYIPLLQLSADARARRTALENILRPIRWERCVRVHKWSSSIVAFSGEAMHNPADLLREVTHRDATLVDAVQGKMMWEFLRIVGSVQTELKSVADATSEFLSALDLAAS